MTEFDDLVEVLGTSNREEVLATLVGLSAKQRKLLGPKFRRSLNDFTSVRRPLNRDQEALAVVATADGLRQAAVIATNSWSLSDECLEDIVQLLGARSPSWLPQFVESVLDEDGRANWRIARGVIRAGLVPATEHEEYFRGTVRGVPGYLPQSRRALADRLVADPELVGDHLLRMLSTERTGRLLAYHDQYVEHPHPREARSVDFLDATWQAALLTLIRDDRLDRDELLNIVLAAPLRDWAAADLGWFTRMHTALDPSVEEIVARQATYARMLTVAHGPSVKSAQQALTRIAKEDRFEPGPVVEASHATLGRPDKASVIAQLRLLEKLRAAHPKMSIVPAVRVATVHPRADVREQAEKLLARLGAPSTFAAVAVFVPPAPLPRPPAARVEPIASADELAEILLHLLEEVDPIGIERAIDGLMRYAVDRPSAAALLLARADAVEGGLDETRMAVVTLVRAWLTPRDRPKNEDWPITLGSFEFGAAVASPETLVGALGRRLTGVAHAVRTGSHTCVALPCRADGSIDAKVLTERLRSIAAGCEPPELELAVAVLRVHPEDRGQVVIPRELRTSRAHLFKRRRGRSVDRAVPPTVATWERGIVSHRYRDWDSQPEHRIPVFADVSAVEGDALDGICSRRQPARTAGQETGYGEYDSQFEQTLAMAALLNPHDVDALAAHAHPFLYRDLRKGRATTVPMLDAIARSSTIIGPPGSSALVLGLAAKDARARTAAQDAMLDLAGCGLLDGVSLGQQAALHLTDQIVVGSRVSTGFAEVARASDAAILPIFDALQRVLPALPERKDAGPFVELAAQLADRTGRSVELPAEFRAIAAGTSSSMLAKALRRLT